MLTTTKKLTLFVCCVLLAVSCNKKTPTVIPNPPAQYNYTRQLIINGTTLMVEIADTPNTMAQGLSDRQSLEQDQGMLFDFTQGSSSTQEIYPSFWMKDMKFNLDFVWISKNKVVGITPDVPKPENRRIGESEAANNLPSYFPPSPVDMVLEVNAGWAKKNNVVVGDEIRR